MDLSSRKLTVEDFQKSGRFAEVQIPYHPPVPIDIMLYKFRCKEGPKYTHEDTLRFLQHLHELKGTKTEICCECGQHLVNLGPSEGDILSINTSQKLQPALTTSSDDATGCECDVQ